MLCPGSRSAGEPKGVAVQDTYELGTDEVSFLMLGCTYLYTFLSLRTSVHMSMRMRIHTSMRMSIEHAIHHASAYVHALVCARVCTGSLPVLDSETTAFSIAGAVARRLQAERVFFFQCLRACRRQTPATCVDLQVPKDASHTDLRDATLRFDLALGVRRRHAPKSRLK